MLDFNKNELVKNFNTDRTERIEFHRGNHLCETHPDSYRDSVNSVLNPYLNILIYIMSSSLFPFQHNHNLSLHSFA